MNNLDVSISDAKSWLLNSGIQNLDSKLLEVKGGFNSWYNTESRDYFYTYSEITGYGISTLLNLKNSERDNLYLLRAVLAGEWLLDKAFDNGGIKTRYYFDRENAPEKYDFFSGIIHSFDNGIALNGLMDLYEATGEERYLKVSKDIGSLLVDKMQKEDGSLYPSYDPRSDKLIEDGEKWSTQSGSYHAKMSMGLIKLYQRTKDKKLLESIVKLCDNSLSFQKDDGRFVSYEKEQD